MIRFLCWLRNVLPKRKEPTVKLTLTLTHEEVVEACRNLVQSRGMQPDGEGQLESEMDEVTFVVDVTVPLGGQAQEVKK